MGSSTTAIYFINELAGNQPIHLNTLQEFLAPYVPLMTDIWAFIWCATLVYLLWIAFIKKDH